MKCLILAGGSGDRLWPLSRKNYPKQFMYVKGNRSLLQETVARNMPFCEEYFILSNVNYEFIIESQMKAFQGLKYRCFLEETGRGTAPAVAIACLCCNPSESVLVINSDQIIENGDYVKAVLRAQELSKEGALVLFGTEAVTPNTGYGYIHHNGERVLSYHEKPDMHTATCFVNDGNYLWNCGMFLFTAGDFLNELHKVDPDLYISCKNFKKTISFAKKEVLLPGKYMDIIPKKSIEHALLEKSDNLKVVLPSFHWRDVADLESLEGLPSSNESAQVIKEECNNVTIINQADEQLIVANAIDDVIIANTKDAIYISKKGAAYKIKDIIKDHESTYHSYFEENRMAFRPWGAYEVLINDSCYKVKKILIYPGQSLSIHSHRYRSEHWSIVRGKATITVGNVTQLYSSNESVIVPIGVRHKVSNFEEDDLVIIEVSMGKIVAESDKYDMSFDSIYESVNPSIVKLEPAFKDYLWGGTKLKELYNKKCDYDILAESWELSSHPDGQSSIAEGKYKGMLFGEYLSKIGKNAIGWKCQASELFPILIKFIDARDTLSVQVHPEDYFALREEREYGKNEMWYVMDCEEGASLYCGFNKTVTVDEVKYRIKENTILDVLNKVSVKKGDTIFVEAGTVHAIGAGILICEIQQNSNSTYRLYDYNRKDKYGNTRELHLNKALQVLKLTPNVTDSIPQNDDSSITKDGFSQRVLGQCKYFESIKFDVQTVCKFEVDDSSFISVIFLSGYGTIGTWGDVLNFKMGDSIFIPAGKKTVIVTGKCSFILTHI